MPQQRSDEETQQQEQSPEQKARDQKTVRGEDLRGQIIESQEKGEDFRATNFGQDVRTPDIDREESRNRSNDKEEPSARPLPERQRH